MAEKWLKSGRKVAEFIDNILCFVYTIIEVIKMYIEDEYTELKVELTKEIKKRNNCFC